MSNLESIPIICQECGEIAMHVAYSPGRAPTPCSNPSSPLYSDPGEGAAISSHPESCINCGAEVQEAYIERECQGYLESQDEDAYDDAHQYEPEDIWDNDDIFGKD